MPSDQLERLNSVLAGRYAIERELAQGGMATVYLANDLRHHRKVAVKVLRPELAAALGADRFTREIAIAARLNHPHILALYDSGAVGGHLFYVMPYIRGESLRQRLEREKQLDIEDALADHSAGGFGPGLRPRPAPGPSGHQAGEHPYIRGRGDGRRLRHRPGRERRARRSADHQWTRAGDPALHESGAGVRGARPGRPERCLQSRLRALRVAHRRAALYRGHRPCGDREAFHRSHSVGPKDSIRGAASPWIRRSPRLCPESLPIVSPVAAPSWRP